MTRVHDAVLWHPEDDPKDALYRCEGCGDPLPDDRAWCSDECRDECSPDFECDACGDEGFFTCECD